MLLFHQKCGEASGMMGVLNFDQTLFPLPPTLRLTNESEQLRPANIAALSDHSI